MDDELKNKLEQLRRAIENAGDQKTKVLLTEYMKELEQRIEAEKKPGG